MSINHTEYELQRDELVLDNEKDQIRINAAQLEIDKIQHMVHKHELVIKQAQARVCERTKQITWLTEKLNG